jgi:hypothetical protein
MVGNHEDRTWQDALVARHLHLFLSGSNQTCIPGFPLVGDGWRELVETAVGRIADVVAAAPSARVTIVETKSKYGTLRTYWDGSGLTETAENAIADAVAKAEARSACTCDVCGEAGVLHQVGGQLLTACAEHAKGVPVPSKQGWENIHLLRSTRDGKPAIIVRRRYIHETDEFVDVDPSSLGIEE